MLPASFELESELRLAWHCSLHVTHVVSCYVTALHQVVRLWRVGGHQIIFNNDIVTEPVNKAIATSCESEN